MTTDTGCQLSVWIAPGSEPPQVVAQVLDRGRKEIRELQPVSTLAEVEGLMEEYGIPAGRWDLSAHAMRILQDTPE